MSLVPQVLTTVETLRSWLTAGRTVESTGRLSDDALGRLIASVSGTIEGACDRVLLAPPAPVTYRFDGDGTQRLVLPEWPIVSLDQLTVDDAVIPPRTDVTQTGYVARACEGWLSLVGYRFECGQQNVVVQARLGYDATLAATDRRHRRALDDLEQACLLLCGLWYEKPLGGTVEMLVEGVAERLPIDGFPRDVQALLLPYRRMGV